jgi:hypothetical protein
MDNMYTIIRLAEASLNPTVKLCWNTVPCGRGIYVLLELNKIYPPKKPHPTLAGGFSSSQLFYILTVVFEKYKEPNFLLVDLRKPNFGTYPCRIVTYIMITINTPWNAIATNIYITSRRFPRNMVSRESYKKG